jgi:hypothetical protein
LRLEHLLNTLLKVSLRPNLSGCREVIV